MLFKKFKTNNLPLIAGVIALVVTGITAHSFLLAPKTFEHGGLLYTHYNNYIIFKQSFFHLIGNKDLYQLYPGEQWDLYKYSPTFSFFMAPLAALPDFIGLLIWNLLNVLVLFFAFWKLPFLSYKIRMSAFAFTAFELITSVQNAQSNALIAGLIIFAFVFLEKKQTALAALCIVVTVFIKIFGLVALALFMFYPDKHKAILYTIGLTLLLAVSPLLVVSASQLSFLYHSWLVLLQNDHSASIGLSVAGFLYTWFGLQTKSLVLIAGVILFCIPFINHKYFHQLKFKLFYLASILIWVVIFNHKAESPTFIIAISGVAVWFFSQKIKTENLVLLIVAFVFTCLSSTDVFPKTMRHEYVVPYVLKAVPCILIWVKITYELIFYKPENNFNSIPRVL